ncbi:hypothetical protein WMF45_39940 [Sorangium sp. So ce448]|uniref:hypothetical protein n=1 Tax=Sorangium sp. So ce448 TaxID=3133314 RepID=UPI003F60DC6E
MNALLGHKLCSAETIILQRRNDPAVKSKLRLGDVVPAADLRSDSAFCALSANPSVIIAERGRLFGAPSAAGPPEIS